MTTEEDQEIISLLYLQNGDNVICSIIDDGSEEILIKDPVRVFYQDGDAIRLERWIPVSEQRVYPIKPWDIVTHCEPNQEMSRLWQTIVTSIDTHERTSEMPKDEQIAAQNFAILNSLDDTSTKH